MDQVQEFNSLSFIINAGPVAIVVAVILLLMSVASWYYIVTKTIQHLRIKAAIKRHTLDFWSAANLQAALKTEAPASPIYQLAHSAVAASQHHQSHANNTLDSACSHEEFVARNMRRTLAHTNTELESGLSVLASVGSVSPFVGLFGTVWGIYHALAAISLSGQATLDKVAGPVGEALIMTAIGLAVAIPAVLAYNAFVKANRNILNQLDHFAQDLHILITTGAMLTKKQNTKSQSTENLNMALEANKRGMPV